MFSVGDLVRVLPPFGYTFTGVYEITSVDASGVYFLGGIEGGFDAVYLEAA